MEHGQPRHSIPRVEEAARTGHRDLIVTVGGDGTLLRGVRVAAAIDGLVLGVPDAEFIPRRGR